jgi:uncharacterized membrane protein
LTSIFLVATIYIINPFAQNIIASIDIAEFYNKNILEVILIIVLLGMTLGFVSSFIAVHKYLEK